MLGGWLEPPNSITSDVIQNNPGTGDLTAIVIAPPRGTELAQHVLQKRPGDYIASIGVFQDEERFVTVQVG